MNYRHAFHAGNAADVFKHAILLEVLRALRNKPAPFCVIDTHAGSAVYRLSHPGEHERGIGSLWPERAAWPALADYFAQVKKCNGGGGRLRKYPGSPLLISGALREQDRAVFTELQPEEYRRLNRHIRRRKGCTVRHMDAWQGLRTFVPPRENRGLVLIDPPYENPGELDQVARALRDALRRWRNGIYLVWYPIKAYRTVQRWYDAVRALNAPAQAIEFLLLPLDVQQRLNGSGVLLINSPWKLAEWAQSELPALARRLAGPEGRPQVRIHDLGPDAGGTRRA